jgi:hypothetical protein
MPTATRLKRQAETCATLAEATYDEESRERYLRLEQLYRALAEAEEPDDTQDVLFPGDNTVEPTTHRLN